MKKIVVFLLSLSIALCLPLSHTASAENIAKAEILLEASTGQILTSSNADRRLPMASVTKIMCLLLWAEMIEDGRLALDDTVKATSAVQDTEGSVIWLVPGEEMSAAELLEAVIISSANDACIALAEHTAGSEAQFVKLMNKRAKELGLTNTHYTNCVGFDENAHYSSAYDTAVLTAELMKHEVYRGWFLTWLDYLRGGETQLVNTNKMIQWYYGILGGKTGTTDNAGCCLTVCAEKNGMRMIAVVLGCADDDSRFSRAEELLDHGFDSYERFTPEIDNSRLLPIPVEKGTASSVQPIVLDGGAECIIRKGRAADVQYEYTFVESLEAPVKQGQFLGEYLVIVDGTAVHRSEIVAKNDIEHISFWYCLLEILAQLISL